MTRGLVLLALTGCARYFGGPDDEDGSGGSGRPDGGWSSAVDAGPPRVDADLRAVPAPSPCSSTIDLVVTGDMFRYWDSVSLDTHGTTWCFELDATLRTHPTYFSAETAMDEPGHLSAFGIAIFDQHDQLVQLGYDAPLTTNETYATVSVDIEDNAIYRYKVVAWARSAPATTPMRIALFQILD